MSEPLSSERVYIGGCYRCKEPMWMEAGTYQTYKRNGHNFFCPHGHQQRFTAGKTDLEKAQEELEKERRFRQQAEQSIEYWRQQEQRACRSAVAYKGQATRLRNRSRAGVCPCCNRTFKQLAAHMANKHPGFATNPDTALPADAPPVLEVIEGGKADAA